MKDIKDIKQALKLLEKHNFRVINGEGSRVKLFPPDRSKPFYTLHLNDKSFHPLRRFAMNNWQIDLLNK
jgi:hypothetical protein